MKQSGSRLSTSNTPLLRGQRGAVAWEYLLVVAVVSVGIVAAMVGPTGGATTKVITTTCSAISKVMKVTFTC